MLLLDYYIETEYPNITLKEKIVINTINPHSYCVAKKDIEFREALRSSNLLVPDGIGIVWAAKVLNKQNIERIAGADIHNYMLEQAQKKGLKVFYMGASSDTLSKIEARIKIEYPAVQYNCYSPPFKATFSENDNNNMLYHINSFKPDILFVGMTAPKQEKWVHLNKEKIDAKIICSIGAVFDFYAGITKRAPLWMQNIGLEWLHRSLINPTRLGKRNLRSNPEFVLDVLKAKLKFGV